MSIEDAECDFCDGTRWEYKASNRKKGYHEYECKWCGKIKRTPINEKDIPNTREIRRE